MSDGFINWKEVCCCEVWGMVEKDVYKGIYEKIFGKIEIGIKRDSLLEKYE